METLPKQEVVKNNKVSLNPNKLQYLNVPIQLIIDAYQNKYLNVLQFFFSTKTKILLWKGQINEFRLNSS
jgi:Holliday junction resolvasome RuvABC endonuclease subunit